MSGFIGRRRELGLLHDLMAPVREGRSNIGRPGKSVLVRGRRRVGKSRLIEEFVDRSGLPHFFFTAAGNSRAQDLSDFARYLADSDLPRLDRIADHGTPNSWSVAFDMLIKALPDDGPSIVVLDEVPYLAREDPAFEGSLQRVFDRKLSKLPVLLILVGSDIAMMQKLNTYGRPFYLRGTEMVIPPLSPSDVHSMLKLEPAESFDAYLLTGGQPLILAEWPVGATPWEYLKIALHNQTSALLVSAERSLAAEFPTQAQARTVLTTIGHGERTFTSIGKTAGELNSGALSRALEILTERSIVARELPLSTKSSRDARYRVDDPYLRFWLSFLSPRMPLIERGRGDRVLENIRKSWTSWRGRAIEPVIRDALWRLADDLLPAGTDVVGGFWTRTNDPEIDLIGADRASPATKITFAGSVKWLENKPFDRRDLHSLIAGCGRLPGSDETTPLFTVTRSGCTAAGVTAIGPSELLDAWN